MAAPKSSVLVLYLALSSLLLAAAAARPEVVDSAATAVSPCSSFPARAASPPCHINCFRADPVCGVNGVTYGCGCPEAACNGVRVAKLGPCHPTGL